MQVWCSIMTSLRGGWQQFDSWLGTGKGKGKGKDIFSLPSRPDQFWGTPRLLDIGRGRGFLALGIKRPVDHSLPPRMRGATTELPLTSSWRGV
jgi:hypothetical protein